MVRYPELGRIRITFICWLAHAAIITVFKKCETRIMGTIASATDMTDPSQLCVNIQDCTCQFEKADTNAVDWIFCGSGNQSDRN